LRQATSRYPRDTGRVEERRPAIRLRRSGGRRNLLVVTLYRAGHPIHHYASQSDPAVRARISDNWPRLHRHRSCGQQGFASRNPHQAIGRIVLLSRAFAAFVESDFDLERVGAYPVRGFNDPIELFAYHG
jgi:hypothetical protein